MAPPKVQPIVTIEEFNAAQGRYIARGSGAITKHSDTICLAVSSDCYQDEVDFDSRIVQAHLAFADFLTSNPYLKTYEVIYDDGDLIPYGDKSTGCDGKEWTKWGTSTIDVTLQYSQVTGAFLVTFEDAAQYFVTPDLEIFKVKADPINGKPILAMVEYPIEIPDISWKNNSAFLGCWLGGALGMVNDSKDTVMDPTVLTESFTNMTLAIFINLANENYEAAAELNETRFYTSDSGPAEVAPEAPTPEPLPAAAPTESKPKAEPAKAAAAQPEKTPEAAEEQPAPKKPPAKQASPFDAFRD